MKTDSQAINREFERVSPDLVKRAAQFQAAILSDVGGRRGTLHSRIQPLSRQMKFAGVAMTVEVRPGDNLMIHAALACAKPGDVIVVDGKGDLSSALTGALMAASAKAGGIAAFVIDGAVRDFDDCAAGDFAIFAAGTNPAGPTRTQVGRVGYPISVAGVAIAPGDLIVGDADGVVVIPRENAAQIIDLAQGKIDSEAKRMAEIRDGKLISSWLQEALVQAGALKKGEFL